MRKEKNISNIITLTILALLAIIFIFPLVNMVSKSLMTVQEVRELPPKIFPGAPVWKNYIFSINYSGDYHGVPYMLLYLKNTLIVVLGMTVGAVFSASLCAFGFTKIKFPGRDLIFFIVLSTMMIPSAVTMIPLYIIFKNLGWINHLLPLWVPMWFGGGAFSIFLIKQYMRTIPMELNESAIIDGANYWQLYSRIILPNCKPVLTVLVIQCFLGAWNDLMGPLLYINTKTKWTLALGITNMGQGALGQVEGLNYIMAACTMMVIVPIVIFLFGQKYFIDNMILTGLKG